MTCVIALKDKNKTYMGYDSYLGYDSWHVEIKQPKVIKCHNIYIGYTGYPRAIQLLEYKLSLRTQNKDESDMHYLINEFSEKTRLLFKDNGYSWVNSNHEYSEEDFVIAYKNDIYKMASNFQIVQSLDNFLCIGAGQEFAYGAMAALTNLEPKERIKTSLKIVGKYSSYVIPPYRVLECSV